MKPALHKIIILFLIFSCIAVAQKKPFTIQDLYDVKIVGSPLVSPKGNKIAFTVTEYELEKGKSYTFIYFMNMEGTDLKTISEKGTSDYNPFWAPDNQSLYFQREGNLFSYNIEHGNIEEVFGFYPGISDPIISPDGNLIAFHSEIYPECGIDEECNKNNSETVESGPLQAYLADDLLFRHWNTYVDDKVPALIVYDLDKNSFKEIARSEWLRYTFMLGGGVKYSFSPDSKEISFIKNAEKNLASSINSDLWIVKVDGSDAVNITKENEAWDGYPVYSPDGKHIAYKKQLIPDYEADRYRIALYNRETGTIQNMTEEFDYTINDLKWSSDSKSIYFNADYEGYSPVFRLDIATNRIEQITGKESIFGFDFADENDGIFYMARWVHKPGELYKFQNMRSIQLTNFNEEFLSRVDVRPAEQLWIDGADGKKVHVFLVKPHNFDPDKKYPLILNVHGGPQSQWMDSFRGDWQIYPGSGYIVAFPNPHGSTGYGSAYTEAISGDWGGKVFEDLMLVTDELEKLPYVDKERIAAMGWSYGGYMMNWFQAKTNRFKCLASMMGIFDLESMWGGTEELWFVNWDLKGHPWNSEDYIKWSPSNFVENFSTPTLIIHGKKDFRVPYLQAVQYFTTLKTLGIDSRLILFKNDGHWPNHVSSMPLYYNAHLEWFHKYLGGEPAPYDSKKMVKNLIFKE